MVMLPLLLVAAARLLCIYCCCACRGPARQRRHRGGGTLALALTRTLTSLYPGSAQVVCSPGCTQCYLPAEGKGGVTLSVDAIGSARNLPC